MSNVFRHGYLFSSFSSSLNRSWNDLILSFVNSINVLTKKNAIYKKTSLIWFPLFKWRTIFSPIYTDHSQFFSLCYSLFLSFRAIFFSSQIGRSTHSSSYIPIIFALMLDDNDDIMPRRFNSKSIHLAIHQYRRRPFFDLTSFFFLLYFFSILFPDPT